MRQVDVDLFEIMPKLQLKDYRFLISCNYHFGFYDINALPLLLGSRGSLCETIGQCTDVINSKMAAHRKFKNNNLSVYYYN